MEKIDNFFCRNKCRCDCVFAFNSVVYRPYIESVKPPLIDYITLAKCTHINVLNRPHLTKNSILT